MKKKYYSNEGSRSIPGIDFELFAHYIFYWFGAGAAVDGACIQPFEMTPKGIFGNFNKVFDALGSEVIGFLINPILYFFR